MVFTFLLLSSSVYDLVLGHWICRAPYLTSRRRWRSIVRRRTARSRKRRHFVQLDRHCHLIQFRFNCANNTNGLAETGPSRLQCTLCRWANLGFQTLSLFFFNGEQNPRRPVQALPLHHLFRQLLRRTRGTGNWSLLRFYTGLLFPTPKVEELLRGSRNCVCGQIGVAASIEIPPPPPPPPPQVDDFNE